MFPRPHKHRQCPSRQAGVGPAPRGPAIQRLPGDPLPLLHRRRDPVQRDPQARPALHLAHLHHGVLVGLHDRPGLRQVLLGTHGHPGLPGHLRGGVIPGCELLHHSVVPTRRVRLPDGPVLLGGDFGGGLWGDLGTGHRRDERFRRVECLELDFYSRGIVEYPGQFRGVLGYL